MKNVTGITPQQVTTLAVLSLAGATSLHAIQDTRNAVREFEERVAEHVERRGGAVSAAVVYAGDVVWAESFGWSDVEQRTRTSIQTTFPTGSFAASLTVVMLAMLDEQGVVQLDDPVVDYVPELRRVRGPREHVDGITLRQLANHTSGLMATPSLPYSVPGHDGLWATRALSLIANTPLYDVPGERVNYSGVGHGVLAVALARASGVPFSDLADILIFQPLGLVNTSFAPSPAIARFSASSSPSGGDGQRSPHHGSHGSVTLDAPGLFTTAEDLARIFVGLFGGGRPQLLSTYGRSNMFNLSAASSRYFEYEAGLMIASSPSTERVVGRGETLAGHSLFAIYAPEDNAGVILLANYRQAAGDFQSAAALLDKLVVQGIDDRSHARQDTSDFVVWATSDVEQRPVQRSCEFPKPSVASGRNGNGSGHTNGYGATNRSTYPASAGGKARVTLEFIVGRDGQPELGSFLVLDASNQKYESSAVDWAFSCRFSPGRVGGKPVRVLVRQTVVF